ncbi:MAG: 16S rRNA (cytosine(1402)-N(4))-methyltransferase, partial [Candidatus Paceibacteria bacterium]
AIVRYRETSPVKTSKELGDLVVRSVPHKFFRVHPATRVFQAIRIVVNNELENITKALWESIEVVDHGGRIVVISYHSLEDRIVKNIFRKIQMQGIAVILTKKPIRPSRAEVLENPSSRSARLRSVELLKKTNP